MNPDEFNNAKDTVKPVKRNITYINNRHAEYLALGIPLMTQGELRQIVAKLANAGTNQTALAEAIGVNRANVSKWLNQDVLIRARYAASIRKFSAKILRK